MAGLIEIHRVWANRFKTHLGTILLPLEGGRERERESRETALTIQTSEELNLFLLRKVVNLLKYMAYWNY